MRLVLDTSVVVAGMRSPAGASARLLDHAAQGRLTIVFTTALALEYEAVCLRSEHILAAGLDAAVAREFVDGLFTFAEPVEVWYALRPQSADPDDDFLIEAAVNGGADAIVTFNTRDIDAPARRFRVPVWAPAEALARVENRP